MSQLRLYKDFYRINFSTTGESYTLINPVSLSVNVINRADSSTIENLSATQESTGIYYIDVTASLYNYLNTYEARWLIQYTNDSDSSKVLKTRFKFESETIYVLGNVVSSVDIDVDNSRIVELSLENPDYIIEIDN